MLKKIFILGKPGSGKSTAAQYFLMLAKDRGCQTAHFNDYPLLQIMAKQEPQKFRLKENDGFDVLDFSVLDDVLRQIEQQIRELEWNNAHLPSATFVTIEFARQNYCAALQCFDPDFFASSSLLFLSADVEICLQRIKKRTKYPTSLDDHSSCSDKIYQTYYATETFDCLSQLQQYVCPPCIVRSIDNNGSLADFSLQLEAVAGAMRLV